jgi:tetraacyldisaccharide 4'-kinase
MQAPGFWQRDGLMPWLLAPLASRVAAVTAQRLATIAGIDPGCSVICVGNLTLGGQGKTPTVLALVARLQAAGRQVFCLTRGYGGALPGPVWVDPSAHSAADVGDEPLLLAEHAPTIVAKDRAAGAIAARAAGAQVIVMDDGFQNPAVRKNLSLIVVDGASGFGNGRVLPAGPLREPVAAGFQRAQGVVCIGPDRVGLGNLLPLGLPCLSAALVPEPEEAARWRGQKVMAFAGIGRPDKFFQTLEAVGAEIVARRAFADHRPYQAADLSALRQQASRAGATLLTTTKDFARLPPADRAGIAVLPVRLVFDDPAALDAVLEPFLGPVL